MATAGLLKYSNKTIAKQEYPGLLKQLQCSVYWLKKHGIDG